MNEVETTSKERSAFWPAGIAAAVVWIPCVVWFSTAHPAMGGMAAGGAAYAALLAGLTVWLVRRPGPEDRLRAIPGTAPLWAWYGVAGITLAWAFVYGFAYGGLYGGVYVPYLTPLIGRLHAWQAARGVDGTTLLNFFSLAVLPAATLLAVGVRPKQMGVCLPVAGTRAATGACLALPAVFVIWGFAAGKLTAAALLVMLVHNFLSNGFSEEFSCRGLLLAPLRAVLPTQWAVVAQGLLFGLIHVGGAIGEEKGDAALAVAGSVALNFPMGVALGVIAVRTGSLALPTAIHIAGHVMKDLLQ